MLFRKDMDPRCAYCQRGQQINEREVACVKRGIVPVEHHCRAFKYAERGRFFTVSSAGARGPSVACCL